MKKLLCFDLDGSLLTDDKGISEENKKAVETAIVQENDVAIVTGRSKRGASMIAKELHMTGQKHCYLVSFQGNLIWDYEKDLSLYTDGILRSDAVKLLNTITEYGLYAQTYTPDAMLIPGMCPEFAQYNSIVHEKHHIVAHWEDIKEEKLPKLMAIDYHNYEKLKDFRALFLETKEAEKFDCFFSSLEYLEFCKRGSNKGHGIQKLAEILGYEAKDVIAVGDERNDISMITYAGVGVAMANAHHSVKEYADYVTKDDNNHSGVAEVIRKFILV